VTDKIRESLSALMDGEASEIEVHRLLREIEQNPELRLRWLSWQQIRSVVRQEPAFDRNAHLELADRVRASIDGEEAYDEQSGGPVTAGSRRWFKPVAALAAAASLVAAIFVTFQAGQVEDSQEFAGASPAGVETQARTGERAPASAQRVVEGTTLVSTAPTTLLDGGSGGAMDDQADQPELRELDEEQLRQVREYLLQHDRMARRNPYAHVVTNPEGPGNQP